MSTDKTHIELRNQNITQESLFEITEDMKVAMEEARIEKIKQLEALKTMKDIDKNNFRPYDPDQDFFMTVSRGSFLDERHPASIIDLIVERLDLSEIYVGYSHEGNQPYHPKMMLKILFYAYYIGIMSCRGIWDCVINRADFIYLASGQVPNFRTINTFRLNHLDKLPGLFTQIVMLCMELGMLDMDHLAIDGQKIHANANYRRSKNLKGLKKEYDKIHNGMEKLLSKDISEHFSEKTRQGRISTMSSKLQQLGDFQKELEALGDEKKRINMTDRDANVMKHKDGTSKPSYNHQSAVDEKYGVVTAVQTTQAGDAPGDLLPIVNTSIENTGSKHKHITADCGFCDYETLEAMEEREEDFFVPDRRYETSKKDASGKDKFTQEDFKKDNEGNYICPAGHKMCYTGMLKNNKGNDMFRYEGTSCSDCLIKLKCTTGKKRSINIDVCEKYREIMRSKLNTDRGREIYMKRQGIVEPVHGDDQKNKGWKQHHLRGLGKATGEFLLIRIATNLGKIVKFRSNEMLSLAPI
jgi:transposase